jgi:hypothetical protein
MINLYYIIKFSFEVWYCFFPLLSFTKNLWSSPKYECPAKQSQLRQCHQSSHPHVPASSTRAVSHSSCRLPQGNPEAPLPSRRGAASPTTVAPGHRRPPPPPPRAPHQHGAHHRPLWHCSQRLVRPSAGVPLRSASAAMERPRWCAPTSLLPTNVFPVPL